MSRLKSYQVRTSVINGFVDERCQFLYEFNFFYSSSSLEVSPEYVTVCTGSLSVSPRDICLVYTAPTCGPVDYQSGKGHFHLSWGFSTRISSVPSFKKEVVTLCSNVLSF